MKFLKEVQQVLNYNVLLISEIKFHLYYCPPLTKYSYQSPADSASAWHHSKFSAETSPENAIVTHRKDVSEPRNGRVLSNPAERL